MIYDFAKRLMDIVGSFVGLMLLSPLLLLVALAIKLDSAGPVMADTPMRAGKNGRLFKIYKFRSMVQNAHEILENNPKLLAEYKKHGYKIFNDPRVTGVGRIIRRFSVDELPQFLNILSGEMSLVGPRAYYPYELKEQQDKYPASRKFVWQATGRSEINFDKRVEMDAEYVKKRSILYDLWIILKTIPAVVSGRGAV